MNAHRVVSSDWPIKEGPGFAAGSLRAQALKCSLGTPTRQHLVLQADQVRLRINRVEHWEERATPPPTWQTGGTPLLRKAVWFPL